MRRKRIVKVEKILSCSGKKIIRYAQIAVLLFVSALSISGMKGPDDAWDVYCEKYGVDPDAPTEDEENFFLDCYVGSAEEEIDMYHF